VSAGDTEKEERFQALLRAVARVPSISYPVAPEEDLLGRHIGPFQVESHLGSGGMGAVYLATDARLGRNVALKLLPRDVAGSPSRRALFVREAKSAAAVSHPNVAAIYEIGEDAERLYIAMEYVAGRTLRAILSSGPLAPEDAYRYALQIARGMARAHRTGIVHRDLKPDNVIVDHDETLKILDFGLAKPLADVRRDAANALTAPGPRVAGGDVPDATPDPASGFIAMSGGDSGLSAAGTPAYMAPEQARGARVDARADVFSFGATAFEMLTGRPGRPNERLPRRLAGPFARVIEQCLRAAPPERPADGAALEAALQRSARRRPRYALAAPASLGVLALAGAISAFHRRSEAPNEAKPRLTQMTFNSVEAPVFGVALSPDGEHLAYVEPRGVFIQEIATRSVRPLTTTPSLTNLWGSVAWFPDGSRLLLGGHESGKSGLYVVDVASGAATSMRMGDSAGFFGSVSPDGRQIAVSRFKGAWEGSVEIVDVERGDAKVLYETHDEELVETPRWSPDGRQVAFVRGIRTSDYMIHSLDIVDTATGHRRTVLRDDRLAQETGDVAFNWSKDGRIYVALAPSATTPGVSGVFALDVADIAADGPTNGGPPLKPVSGFAKVKVYDISFDASGERMAIVRIDTQADVFMGSVSEDGQRLDDVKRLTLSDGNEYPSDWSSDSREMLLSTSDQDGHLGIAVLSLDSRDAVPIPGATGPATWPVLGPSGTGILYWQLPARPTSRAPLDLMFLEAHRAPRRVYGTPRDVFIPGRGRPAPRTWSVQCARLTKDCFVAHPSDDGRDETVLEALDVERGTAHPRGRFEGKWQYGFALSPDATRIAVPTRSRDAIQVLDLDGSQLLRLRDSSAFFRSVAWSHDGGTIFAIGTAGDAFGGIFRFGLDGSVRLLWSTKEGSPANLRLSPDGRRLAFLMTPLHANVWLRQE